MVACSWIEKKTTMNIRICISILIILFVSNCSRCNYRDNDICNRFQEYSERCQNDLLQLIKERPNNYDSLLNKSEKEEFDYKLIEYRIRRKISEKQGFKQCMKLRDSNTQDSNKRLDLIRHCLQKNDCRDFAQCIISF